MSGVRNPSGKPVTVDAKLLVQDGTKIKAGSSGELADPTEVFSEFKSF